MEPGMPDRAGRQHEVPELGAPNSRRVERPGLVLNPTNLANLEEASRLVGCTLTRCLPDGSPVTLMVGDASGNGYIEDDDLEFLKTLLSDSEEGARLRERISPHELAACDVDGDGVVDLRDLVALMCRRVVDLQRLARTDELTGLDNRRSFKEKAQLKISTAKRYEVPMVCLALDLDHFKEINDTYGHAVGDLALVRVAELLREHTRDSDVICRYGGDEFLVILDHVGVEGARTVVERLMQAVSEARVGPGAPLALSVGAVAFEPSMDLPALMHAADMALYRAKRAGRGRAEIA